MIQLGLHIPRLKTQAAALQEHHWSHSATFLNSTHFCVCVQLEALYKQILILKLNFICIKWENCALKINTLASYIPVTTAASQDIDTKSVRLRGGAWVQDARNPQKYSCYPPQVSHKLVITCLLTHAHRSIKTDTRQIDLEKWVNNFCFVWNMDDER